MKALTETTYTDWLIKDRSNLAHAQWFRAYYQHGMKHDYMKKHGYAHLIKKISPRFIFF